MIVADQTSTTGRLAELAGLDQIPESTVELYCDDDWLQPNQRGGESTHFDTTVGEDVTLDYDTCEEDPDLDAFQIPPRDRAPARIVFCKRWLDSLDPEKQLNHIATVEIQIGTSINDFSDHSLAAVLARELLLTGIFGECTSPYICDIGMIIFADYYYVQLWMKHVVLPSVTTWH